MRSYTNKQGELITVSEEHLDMAIRLKQELQKSSPSRRCSWGLHKNLMEKEGHYDSDTNESYRCLVKSYQKSVGELPEVEKYADMVVDSKLDSIKELVGDIRYEKRENQHVLRQINKGTNQLIDFSLVIEELTNSLERYDWSKMVMNIERVETTGDTKMIVCLSDLHIGALVDIDINKFNFDIATKRLEKYAGEVIARAIKYNVSEVHIVNLGDVIEHSNMRYGQAFKSEFAFSDQITYASDLIMNFIEVLAEQKKFNITYAGFAGNHDRITDKDKNLDGDHAVKMINKIVKTYIDKAKIGNVEYVQAKDYGHELLDINGRNFKFVHGDLDSFKNELLVQRHSSIDKVEYDAVVMGHYHHYRYIETETERATIMFGSLKGADEYGEKIRKLSNASQGIIIVDGYGNYRAERIGLQL